MIPLQSATPALSDGLVDRLCDALAAGRDGGAPEVEAALGAMCSEARARSLPPESIVLAMKTAWQRAARPRGLTDDEWSHAYYAAIGRCLTTYFESARPSPPAQ